MNKNIIDLEMNLGESTKIPILAEPIIISNSNLANTLRVKTNQNLTGSNLIITLVIEWGRSFSKSVIPTQISPTSIEFDMPSESIPFGNTKYRIYLQALDTTTTQKSISGKRILEVQEGPLTSSLVRGDLNNLTEAELIEYIKRFAPSNGNGGNGGSGSGNNGVGLVFKDYQTHNELKADLSQKEGTIGKVIGPNEPQEAFIFTNGKWYEFGNENVRIYVDEAERLATKVIDSQLAYVVDSKMIYIWTDGVSGEWIRIPDQKLIDIITQDLSNKQNTLTPEQLQVVNLGASNIATKALLDTLKAEVDDNYHLLNRLEQQVQANYFETLATNNLQTTNIQTLMDSLTVMLQDIANIKGSPNIAAKLVKFGTGLVYTTLASAKAGEEPTATDGAKFDFLNMDNSEFHTLLYTVDAPHWHQLGTGNVDLSNYPNNQALQQAISAMVSKSAYDTKIAEIESLIQALQNSIGTNGSAITTLQNKDTALQQAIDALKVSAGDSDWIGSYDYIVGPAYQAGAFASASVLPTPVAADFGKTALTTQENQQYMVLKFKLAGQDNYFWAAVADADSPLTAGSTYHKPSWGELLMNPDTQKFLKLMMGDSLESNVFRIIEGLLPSARFEIGGKNRNFDTFQVHSDHIALNDNQLKTISHNITTAINELFDDIVLLKRDTSGLDTRVKALESGGTGGGSPVDALKIELLEKSLGRFIGTKVEVLPTTDLGPKGTLVNLELLAPATITNVGHFAQVVSDTSANNGNYIIIEYPVGHYEWVKVPNKPIIGTRIVFDSLFNGVLEPEIDKINKNITDDKALIDGIIADKAKEHINQGTISSLALLNQLHPASKDLLSNYYEVNNDTIENNGYYMVLKTLPNTYKWVKMGMAFSSSLATKTDLANKVDNSVYTPKITEIESDATKLKNDYNTYKNSLAPITSISPYFASETLPLKSTKITVNSFKDIPLPNEAIYTGLEYYMTSDNNMLYFPVKTVFNNGQSTHTDYYWAAINDKIGFYSVQKRIDFVKLLSNPFWIKYLDTLMGNVEAKDADIFSLLTQDLTIGTSFENFIVNSKHIHLKDESLLTQSKDVITAINEIYKPFNEFYKKAYNILSGDVLVTDFWSDSVPNLEHLNTGYPASVPHKGYTAKVINDPNPSFNGWYINAVSPSGDPYWARLDIQPPVKPPRGTTVSASDPKSGALYKAIASYGNRLKTLAHGTATANTATITLPTPLSFGNTVRNFIDVSIHDGTTDRELSIPIKRLGTTTRSYGSNAANSITIETTATTIVITVANADVLTEYSLYSQGSLFS